MSIELLYKIVRLPPRVKLSYDTQHYLGSHKFSLRKYYFIHVLGTKTFQIAPHEFRKETTILSFFDKEFDIHGRPLDTISRG